MTPQERALLLALADALLAVLEKRADPTGYSALTAALADVQTIERDVVEAEADRRRRLERE
jgi:hypothetical protein